MTKQREDHPKSTGSFLPYFYRHATNKVKCVSQEQAVVPFLLLRLYRYVQPRANGSFKCSEDVLKMYRSSDGRPLPETGWHWVVLHGLFS